MNIDETLLLAYVDGELNADARAEVEAAVAHSPELANQLALMRASVLPYAAAYETRPVPPVPPELTRRIGELASVSTTNAATARRPRQFSSWRMAAAFVAGAILTAVTLPMVQRHAGVMTASADSSWVGVIANYQSLYTRETVANVNEDRPLTEKILGELRARDGIQVLIPDLRGQGLTFKRVQRLNYQDHAVVQVVYLPEHGDPVALCLTRSNGPDQVPQSKVVDGMQAVEWRQDHLDYVLLGRGSQVDLAEVGHQIAHGHVSNLYGA